MSEQSREPEILKSIIDDTEYNKTPQSRNEEILLSILNDTEYTKTPQSREEELLLELKDKIGHGITVEPLSVTENGTYTAPAGTAYSPVEVNITPPQLVKRVTGNPVEFSDSADAPVVKCVTQITGSQDLHGQDKPWVGGSGKNELPLVLADIKSANTSGTWSGNTYTLNSIAFTINTDNGGNVTGIKVQGLASANTNLFLTATNGVTIKAGTYTWSCAGTISGSVVWIIGGSSNTAGVTYHIVGGGSGYSPTSTQTVSDGTTGYNIIQVANGYNADTTLYPQCESGTNTSSFAPYSNICPITAYTEGEIVERGKNLFDKTAIDPSKGYIDTQSLNSDGTYKQPGTYNGYISEYIPVPPNTNMVFSGLIGINTAFCLYDSSKQYISGEKYSNRTSIAFTTTANTAYFRASIPNVNVDSIMLELGTTPTPYEPYTSTTHATTFPSAIYRGSEDVVNGEVSATWVKVVFDGTETWQYSDAWSNEETNVFYCTGYLLDANFPSFTGIYYLSNEFEALSRNDLMSATMPSFGYSGSANNPSLTVRINKTISDVAAFKTWLGTNNLEIAYELATPTTSPVTPTNLPLKTLFGYNHIESSTGEMVLDYITDKYQNFVDTVNRAVPNTRKSGSAAMEVFMSLEQYEESEPDTEDVKGESK